MATDGVTDGATDGVTDVTDRFFVFSQALLVTHNLSVTSGPKSDANFTLDQNLLSVHCNYFYCQGTLNLTLLLQGFKSQTQKAHKTF